MKNAIEVSKDSGPVLGVNAIRIVRSTLLGLSWGPLFKPRILESYS